MRIVKEEIERSYYRDLNGRCRVGIFEWKRVRDRVSETVRNRVGFDLINCNTAQLREDLECEA